MAAINKLIPPVGLPFTDGQGRPNLQWYTWLTSISALQAGSLLISNNLGDVGSKSASRTNLGVPSLTGTGASGTWAISISGNALTATTATSATTASLASTVTTNANLTGVVTSTGNSTIFASMSTNSVLLGNGTSTPLQVAPSTSGNVLTSNGTTWQSSPSATSGGTVTSITAGTGLSGGTITTSGTIAITNPVGTLSAINVYCSTAQSIPSTTFTKIKFDTKVFDLNSDFDATTNYRWTPTIAGKYIVSTFIIIGTTTTNAQIAAAIYKNGSALKYGNVVGSAALSTFITSSVNTIVAMNGSTDYLEVFFYQADVASTVIVGGIAFTDFSGYRLAGS